LRKTLPLILLLAFVSTACGLASSEINEACLVYSGGVVEDKAFEQVLPAGSTNNQIGAGSDSFCYRIDQRSYIADEGDIRDIPPVTVVSSDTQQMAVEFEAYFTLNQDEETLRRFHENLGVKTDPGAWTPEGWSQLLSEYFRPSIERALESAALEFGMLDLYSSEETRRAFAASAVQAFRRNLDEVVGGNYFCGPSHQEPGDPCGDITLAVGRPTIVNAETVAALEQRQTNQAQIEAQNIENERISTQLEATREQVELLGPEVYAWLQAIEAARTTGTPVPPFFGSAGGPSPVIDVGSQAGSQGSPAPTPSEQ
jgi:hypothetical protein